MSESSSPAMSAGPALTRKLTRCYGAADPNDPQPKPASTVIRALDSLKATDSSDETDHLSMSTDDGPGTPVPAPKRKHGYPNSGKKLVSQ